MSSSTAGVSHFLSPLSFSFRCNITDTGSGGVGRAGLTASAWAIKMGFVTPHPSFQSIVESAKSQAGQDQAQGQGNLVAELEHRVVMSMVERVIAMIRCRRGLKAIESFEQVQFLAKYVAWLRTQGVMA